MSTHTHLHRPAILVASATGSRRGAHDAFLLLRTVFTIAPIAFGLDKFFWGAGRLGRLPRALDQQRRARHAPRRCCSSASSRSPPACRWPWRHASEPRWWPAGWRASSSTSSPSPTTTISLCATSASSSPLSHSPASPPLTPRDGPSSASLLRPGLGAGSCRVHRSSSWAAASQWQAPWWSCAKRGTTRRSCSSPRSPKSPTSARRCPRASSRARRIGSRPTCGPAAGVV